MPILWIFLSAVYIVFNQHILLKYSIVHHPPYIPNLVRCDLFLNQKILHKSKTLGSGKIQRSGFTWWHKRNLRGSSPNEKLAGTSVFNVKETFSNFLNWKFTSRVKFADVGNVKNLWRRTFSPYQKRSFNGVQPMKNLLE